MDRRQFLASATALLSGCGGGGGVSAPAAKSATTQTLAPDHPALSYTDCAAVDVTHERARFSRPVVQSLGYQWTAPGARVRFWTDSETVTIRLAQTTLMPHDDLRNSVGVVLVDGVATTWSASDRVTLAHVGRRMRLHELVMPYNDSVDFLGVEIDGTAAAAPRTGLRLAVLGDSISHGFWASDVAHSWPCMLAQSAGLELVNLATGGRMCVPTDGTMAAGCAPDVITYLIGYNEFSQQTDPAEFGTRYAQTLANIRAGRPGARVLAITPIWSPNTAPIPLEAYRQAICDATQADPMVTLVDGLALMPADPVALTDTVHPSDSGAASIAHALASIL